MSCLSLEVQKMMDTDTPSPPHKALRNIDVGASSSGSGAGAVNGGEGTVGNTTITPLWLTAKFWKRFSVVLSILFSVISLILSAIVSLKPESQKVLHALTISSIVVNSLSISLSALTSLDWQQEDTHDKIFAERLMKIAHVHEGENQALLITKGLGDGKRGAVGA